MERKGKERKGEVKIFCTTLTHGEGSIVLDTPSSSASKSGEDGAPKIEGSKLITQNSHFRWLPFLEPVDFVRMIATISSRTSAQPTHAGNLRRSGISILVMRHTFSYIAMTVRARRTFGCFCVFAWVAMTNVGPPKIQYSILISIISKIHSFLKKNQELRVLFNPYTYLHRYSIFTQ